MPRYKMVGNNRIELTAEELTELNARETAWSNDALNRALNNLREKRNKLLTDTDWMANSDVTMSDNWKTYRQALRDLTDGLDTVAKVKTKMKLNVDKDNKPILDSYKNFPTKPSGE